MQNKQWDRAFKILDEMYELNLKPDVISFGAAISACGKVRNDKTISMDAFLGTEKDGPRPRGYLGGTFTRRFCTT